MEKVEESPSPRSKSGRAVRYTIAITTITALGGLMFGYDIGVIADAKLSIQEEFGLGNVAIETVVSSVLVGSFLGALLAGRLCERIGRRQTNIFGGIVFALGCGGCALSIDFSMIVVFRVLMGIGVGFSSVAGPLYIAEIAGPGTRGAMVSIYQLAITIGIFVAFLLGLVLTPDGLWRLAFGIGSIMGGALVLGMLFMPRSPRWLFGQGRRDEARSVLVRTLGDPVEVDREFKDLSRRLEGERTLGLVEAIRSKPAVRLALVVAVGLAFLQQASGINAILYYAPEILESVGLGERKLTFTAVIGFVNMAATFIAIGLVDRVGRRPLLMVGAGTMMLAQVVIAVTSLMAPEGASGLGPSSIVILSMTGLAVVAFAFSLGPLVWLAISELFPVSSRGACVGLASSINWIANFAVAQGALSLLDWSPAAAFGTFAAFNLATILFVAWRMPETRGVPLDEIEREFEARAARSAGG